MSQNTDTLENIIEDDAEDTPLSDSNTIYQINSFGADFLVDGLVARMDRGDIYRPDFQRIFVWTLPQASRFIESILLGLPIPGIFLYREEDTQKHLIIDGLQRLTTIHAYQKGKLPNSSKVFKLVGVKERFVGKSLDELESSDQRRFQDAAIHATIIQQTLPEADNSSVYHIFDRLNSGGTPLQPQEMRAAIYHGKFQILLEKLNTYEGWRKIFGPLNKRAKDQELILRFLALSFNRENYSSPMKGFLNTFMSTHRHLNTDISQYFEEAFYSTVDTVIEELGERPFRPVRALNVAVFDAVMTTVYELGNDLCMEFSDQYDALLADKDFIKSTNQSTSDESNVANRIQIAIEYLGF